MRIKLHISEHERLRRAAGLTAGAMGLALEYADHSYISHIERGAMPASPDYRAKAARLLQVAESRLFDDDGYAR